MCATFSLVTECVLKPYSPVCVLHLDVHHGWTSWVILCNSHTTTQYHESYHELVQELLIKYHSSPLLPSKILHYKFILRTWNVCFPRISKWLTRRTFLNAYWPNFPTIKCTCVAWNSSIFKHTHYWNTILQSLPSNESYGNIDDDVTTTVLNLHWRRNIVINLIALYCLVLYIWEVTVPVTAYL